MKSLGLEKSIVYITASYIYNTQTRFTSQFSMG